MNDHNYRDEISSIEELQEALEWITNFVIKDKAKMTIKEILRQWKKESGFTGVIQYRYNFSDNTLSVYLHSPGWLIGKGGCLYDKYFAILREKSIGKIIFVETNYGSI